MKKFSVFKQRHDKDDVSYNILLISQTVQAHDDHNNSWPFREGTQAVFWAQSPIQKAWNKVSNLSQHFPHHIEEDTHPKWKKMSNINIYDYYIF